MKKLYAAIFIACFVFPTSVNATEVIPFEKIMSLMNGADIRYERVSHYSNVRFKVFKKSDAWILQNRKNRTRGTIESAGDNKISVKDFPSNWTILGTWKFSKNGDRCRIDHTNDGKSLDQMNMIWDCGG